MHSINPYTGKLIQSFDSLDSKILQNILDQVQKQSLIWKKTPLVEKSNIFINIAKELKNNKEKYAQLITQEMGKVIIESRAEIEKCAWVCEYYAEHATQFLTPVIKESDASKSSLYYQPLGTVLAIMPWNFPFWQVFRALAPIVMAGNTFVLKHASNTPQCALAIEQLLLEAGLPQNTMRTLLIPAAKVIEVIQHPSIRAITLTGSEQAGKKVAAMAGEYLKKSVLELGGSDAFIVFEDADFNYTLKQAIKGRFINTGQSCIAAKRFLIQESIADKFVEALTERIQDLSYGDPMDEKTKIAPLAKPEFAKEIDLQVQESIQQGAIIKTGCQPIENTYAGYQASLLDHVTENMTVFQQETFGPVATVTRFKTPQQAITLANNTPYGLGNSIWTANIKLAEEMALQLESGSVFINGIVKSDPRLPFGGVKASGFGRELGAYGMLEFVNVKVVWEQ